jgi:acetyl-CoA acetyltransferase
VIGWSLEDTCIIAGVGTCGYYRSSEHSEAYLGAAAVSEAARDAGIAPQEIDGLITYQYNNDTVRPSELAQSLGIESLSLHIENYLGGTVGAELMAIAVMSIKAGLAKNVVVYRAAKHRSGRVRIGGSGQAADAGGIEQFLVPHGWANFFVDQAAQATRHMWQFGTSEEDLGAVALNAYRNAQLNPRAVTQGWGPTSMAEYLEAPYLSYPFRRWDFTSEADGACAYLVTSSERAADIPSKPVYISGLAQASTPNPQHTGRFAHFDLAGENAIVGSAHYFARDLFQRAGRNPSDIDLAMIYDASSYSVISQLEDLGFCPKGQGGRFASEGRINLDGDLPVNPNGGLLAEGYLHGTNLVVEAVEQLRGGCGDRQVHGAEVALFTSGGAGTIGGGGILTTR